MSFSFCLLKKFVCLIKSVFVNMIVLINQDVMKWLDCTGQSYALVWKLWSLCVSKPPFFLFMSLPHSLSISPSFSLFSLSLSLFFSLSTHTHIYSACVCVCLSLRLFLSLPLPMSLSLYFCLFFSPLLSLTLFQTLSLSLLLYVSLTLCLFVSFSIPQTLCLSASLNPWSDYESVHVSFCLFVASFVCLPISLTFLIKVNYSCNR